MPAYLVLLRVEVAAFHPIRLALLGRWRPPPCGCGHPCPFFRDFAALRRQSPGSEKPMDSSLWPYSSPSPRLLAAITDGCYPPPRSVEPGLSSTRGTGILRHRVLPTRSDCLADFERDGTTGTTPAPPAIAAPVNKACACVHRAYLKPPSAERC